MSYFSPVSGMASQLTGRNASHFWQAEPWQAKPWQAEPYQEIMCEEIKNGTGETIDRSSTFEGGDEMTTRRNFLKGAAASGIAFCSCGMLDAARAQPGPMHLPVKVGGKRVMTVDAHAHCYFHETISLMGDDAAKVLPPVKGVPEHFIVIEQRLKEMDAMGIDMEVLSVNPFWYRKDRDTASAIVKLQNEKLAELCAARPERFSAFASLTLD